MKLIAITVSWNNVRQDRFFMGLQAFSYWDHLFETDQIRTFNRLMVGYSNYVTHSRFLMPSSKLPIYSAMAANLLITITKFVAASVTGSSAMVSEGIHSLVDTSNEVLLLLGIRRSKKPADAKRPFGYGRELYFWSFIVSILIFGVGGGISFYEGVSHLQHPNPIEDPHWNYIVLGIAIVLDGISLITALREFNVQRGTQDFWPAVKKSRDPTTFVVLFEDAADVLGLLIAFLGVFLGHQLNNPYLDGVASILIGLILTAVSLLLARESRSLLMGESADDTVLAAVTSLTEADQDVQKVQRILSVYMGPEEIILFLGIAFRDDLTTRQINESIERIRQTIQQQHPSMKQIYLEPEFLPTAAPISENKGS